MAQKKKEKELGYTLLEIWIKKRLGFKGKIIKQCRAIAATTSFSIIASVGREPIEHYWRDKGSYDFEK